MYEVFALLIICSGIAVLCYYLSTAELKTVRGVKMYKFKDESIGTKFFFVVLLLILVFFSGLRTTMNDTATYLKTFSRIIPDTLSEIKNINWSIGRNPLFVIYQIIIRSVITRSGNVFLLLTALIVVSSNLAFLHRYSRHFGYSVFYYLSFCVFAFSMAAMKQTLAMAIGIWSVPLFIQKRRIRAVLLILIAMLIHPYVVVYLAAPLLYKGVWDRRTILLLITTGIGVALYGTLITQVLSVTASLGDDYDIGLFTSGNALNIFRFLFYLIIPILSFFAKDQIKQADDPVLNACVNLSVLAASFAVFARIGDANMFGRMASYLDIFQCVAFGMLMKSGTINARVSLFLRSALILAYIFFYYSSYDKYVSGWNLNWDECIYDHITIFEFFKGW